MKVFAVPTDPTHKINVAAHKTPVDVLQPRLIIGVLIHNLTNLPTFEVLGTNERQRVSRTAIRLNPVRQRPIFFRNIVVTNAELGMTAWKIVQKFIEFQFFSIF